MEGSVPDNVLLVAADKRTAELVSAVVGRRDARLVRVADAGAAAGELDERQWSVVMVDLTGDGQTAALVGRIRQEHPELPLILFGDEASLERSELALRAGCTDLLSKPVQEPMLGSLLEVLLPAHRVPLAACAEDGRHCLYRIAGTSPAFLQTILLARKVAPTPVPVLITGESGTGKELISRLIHCESNRGDGPFIHVNCAALSESLLESELFGHEKGAFTGAHERRAGRFERAHGGTLLLDEISETTPKLQAELLRVLEQQAFERVGGSRIVQVNVRVISTSNRDLAGDVERGRFRRDLYYRIGGIHLSVPPVRQRKEDIPALVWHFVNLHAREVRRRISELDEEMLDLFARCDWPGNVRQLRNVVRAALILGEGPVLSLRDAGFLRAELEEGVAAAAEAAQPPATLRLQELEREAILEALRRTKRNQVKAARLLGITDRTLREKLRRYREAGELTAAGENRW